jgi:FkbH-like protein
MQTLSGLTHGPDLMAWNSAAEDRLRVTDIAAAASRAAALVAAGDPLAYLQSLETRLEFAVDPRDQAGRIQELSQKTNQFNLALRRLGDADIARWLDDPDAPIVTVRLSDRLSDSGIVAIVLMRRNDRRLRVEEICISCRALGRGLEELMVCSSINRVAAALGCDEVAFAYALGARNAPARDWLAAFTGHPLGTPDGYCHLGWPPVGLATRLQSIPVQIDWKESSPP